MGKIVLLDDLTINKIAAGEVIERPASVVKELVENSIDAGADNISIEIKNGGISYIRITDNGKGFDADDLEIAFERHATSKIRNANDLETVKTMGFRGEALASIAAIARVELVTKTENSDVGHRIVVEGGKVILKEEIGCSKGTSITVENLFYNTPVRYKFLKKDFTESGYIEDIVTRIALVNTNIAIKFINSGKTLIQTSGNGEIKDVVYGIYGKDIAENIINVEYYFEDMAVKGVIGRPSIARSNRSNQLFFVNKRYVKDKTLTSAAEQGFKGCLGIGKFGFLILNIEMDPHKLDVNVHPAKLEVRFQEENKIFKLVYHAIKEALLKGDIASQNNRTIIGENMYSNDYMNKIEKTDKQNEDNNYVNKDNSEDNKNYHLENVNSENKGIGGFFKNILSNPKNEFTTGDDNLVEQLYRDKLQKEHDAILHNIENSNNEITGTQIENNVENNIENNTQENETEYTKEQQYDNIIVKEDGAIELKRFEKNDNITAKNLGLNSDEFKGNTNLERLVKELEENLEKLNLKSNVPQAENLDNNSKEESDIDNVNEPNNSMDKLDNGQILKSAIDNYNLLNEMEINNKSNIAEEGSESEGDKKQDIIKEDSIQNTAIYSTLQDDNKVQKNVSSENNIEKVDNTNNTEKDEEPSMNFEEMYAKMFGTTISSKNKVEEKMDKGYAVKQEDLKTVEKFSLFTNSSVYSRPAYKFIGIVFENNIIIEYEREMYIINQQAANERIIYEKVKKNYYSDTDKDSQLMLLPDIINLTSREMGIAKDTMYLFRNAGFDLEEFGENTVKLSGVPSICIDLDTRQLFLEILNAVNTVARTAKHEIEEKLIETISRKVAEKAKMALTAKEVDDLMIQLLALPQPFVSPQGTPTAIRMSKYDIERKFSRR